MPKSALDLARALKRYTRMRPENAYVALAKEWPRRIVSLVCDVLWSEVKGRSVKEITRDIFAMMRKARAATAAVAIAKRQMSDDTARKAWARRHKNSPAR